MTTKFLTPDPKVVTMIIEKIEERFGKMTVVRGKEHVFLGMNIRYTDEGTAVIVMKDYFSGANLKSPDSRSSRKWQLRLNATYSK
jgi:hypothetical protein